MQKSVCQISAKDKQKKMRYTIAQRQYIVSQYLLNDKNLNAVIPAFESKYGMKAPKKESIMAMIKKWDDHGTVHDRIKGVSGRQVDATTQENVEAVRQEYQGNPQLSLRRGSQALNIPKTSLWRILKKKIEYHPYKVLKRHHIPQRSIEPRINRAKTLLDAIEEIPDILPNIWFTDEAHFELTHVINKQNDRNWCPNQPYIIVENPLHPLRTTVWAAISARSA